MTFANLELFKSHRAILNYLRLASISSRKLCCRHSLFHPSAISGSSAFPAVVSPGFLRTVQLSNRPTFAPGQDHTSAQSSPAPLDSVRNWALCLPLWVSQESSIYFLCSVQFAWREQTISSSIIAPVQSSHVIFYVTILSDLNQFSILVTIFF